MIVDINLLAPSYIGYPLADMRYPVVFPIRKVLQLSDHFVHFFIRLWDTPDL